MWLDVHVSVYVCECVGVLVPQPRYTVYCILIFRSIHLSVEVGADTGLNIQQLLSGPVTSVGYLRQLTCSVFMKNST
jgi:hypothetical protein